MSISGLCCNSTTRVHVFCYPTLTAGDNFDGAVSTVSLKLISSITALLVELSINFMEGLKCYFFLLQKTTKYTCVYIINLILVLVKNHSSY